MGLAGGFSRTPKPGGLLHSAAPRETLLGAGRWTAVSPHSHPSCSQGLVLAPPAPSQPPSSFLQEQRRGGGGEACWQIAEQGFLPAASSHLPPHSWGSLSLCLPEEPGPGSCWEPPLEKLITSPPWLRNGGAAALERPWELPSPPMSSARGGCPSRTAEAGDAKRGKSSSAPNAEYFLAVPQSTPRARHYCDPYLTDPQMKPQILYWQVQCLV